MAKKKVTKKKAVKKKVVKSECVAVPKEDQEWQAEYDAHTLASVQEILQDKARLRRAKVQANKMLKKQAVKLNALKK